ncbi:hypothetical protein Tco_0806974 [Tanacetum coccineum]
MVRDVKGKGKAIMKDEKQELTGIKKVDDLEQRIKNLEAIFSHLRDKKLKQKEVIVISDDDKSSGDDKSLDDDTSKDSQDYLSEDSSEDMIKFLSSHDPQWQFPKQSHKEELKHVIVKTEEEDPLSIDVPMQTKEKDPLLDIGHGFLFGVVEGGGAIRSLGALKPSTHAVIVFFLYPLGAVEATCALEVDAMGTFDHDVVEVDAIGALDVVSLSLNILISASMSGYLTTLNKTTSSSQKRPSSLKSSSSLDTSTTFASLASDEVEKPICLRTSKYQV